MALLVHSGLFINGCDSDVTGPDSDITISSQNKAFPHPDLFIAQLPSSEANGRLLFLKAEEGVKNPMIFLL